MQFSNQQSDSDRLQDKVTAAMETGNPGEARLILAEHRDTFPEAVHSIRSNVLAEYGIRL